MPLFRTLKWDHVTHAVGQGVLLRDLQHNGISFVSTICLRHFCLSLTPNIDVPPCWRGNCPFFLTTTLFLEYLSSKFYISQTQKRLRGLKREPKGLVLVHFPWWGSFIQQHQWLGFALIHTKSILLSVWHYGCFFRKIYYNTSKMISIWFQHCFSVFAFF